VPGTILSILAAHLPLHLRYRLIGKKGEGTFSEVLKAQGIKNGKYVAIKCMKNHFDSLDQVNNLREIQALRRLSPHPGVIKLCEVLYDQPTRRLALVFELMDMNIYELIRGRRQYLKEPVIKNYMYQLLKSMDHMHRNGIFHRDIKPENILITDDELKLADFGSCRGIYSKQPYTEYISTRWYRAPECLLTDGFYNYKMDMWGVGCVFFEVLSLYPLFPGTNELDQVTKIHQILGTPPAETLAKLKKHSNSHIDFNFPHKEATPLAKLIPHCSPDCIDVIARLLAYDPDDRISARQAVKHAYFKDLRAAAMKEAQAAQEAGGGEGVTDDARGHAPSGAPARGGQANAGGMLPSIGGGDPPGKAASKGKAKASHHGGAGSSSEPQDNAPAASDGKEGAPSQTSSLPYVHASAAAADDEPSSSTLPPIGGGLGGGGLGGGVGALKIDSKSLMGSGKTTHSIKSQVRTGKALAPSNKSKIATNRSLHAVGQHGNMMPQRSTMGSMAQLDPDWAVGNSQIGSQNASQSQIDPDGVSHAGSLRSKLKVGGGGGAYQSPYSQAPRHKAK